MQTDPNIHEVVPNNAVEMMRRQQKERCFKYLLASVAIFIFLQTNFAKSLSQYFFKSFPYGDKSAWHHDSIIRQVVDEFDAQGNEAAQLLKDEECPIPHLQHRIGSAKRAVKAECSRIAPVSGSCSVAREIFLDILPLECEIKPSILCWLQGSGQKTVAVCNISQCALPVALGTINSDAGELQWHRFRNTTSLQQYITHMVQPTNTKPHYGFCFLKCLKSGYEDYLYDVIGKFDKEEGIPMYDDMHSFYYMSQVLLLPPVLKETKALEKKTKFNINMIFIDSVSRHHFYRSLPESVKILESINREHNKNGHGPMTLDFELVQSLRSRTFESLQALFSGYINPSEKPFGVLDMPPVPLSTEALLGPFKSLGYHTLWLEDLCWEWEWGISKDLKAYNNSLSSKEIWTKLSEALKRAGIDGLDTTLSSCEILRINGVNDHFHGPDTVCYGGQFQHKFAFDYLKLYQSHLSSRDQGFVTFLETNVGHEDTGLRIKTVDQSLADYIQFSSRMNDTLTILFSDHGNTYGSFLDSSLEGRVEMFHPLLMMVLPQNIQKQLGPDQTNSLISNQGRLVSLLDLHHMLNHIAMATTSSENRKSMDTKNKFVTALKPPLPVSKYDNIRKEFRVPENGLLSRISPSRTCDQMPRIMPNLCICERFENAEKNDSDHVMFAYLSLSKLNTAINTQFRKANPQSSSSFGRCQRLVLESFTNVKTSFGKNHTVFVMMDLHIRLTNGSPAEVFFVAVKYVIGKQGSLELTKIDRLTPYSGFKACADPGVDLNLCVCDKKSGMKERQFTARELPTTSVLTKSTTDFVDASAKCLYLLTTQNAHGMILEAFNLCRNESFKVTVKAVTENLQLTLPTGLVEVVLRPFDVALMVAGVQFNPKEEILWKYKIALNHVRE